MIKAKNFEYNTNVVSEEAHFMHIALYREYVDKTNEILQQLQQDPQHEKAHKNYSCHRSYKKELSYNLNSVVLHEMFFKNLGKGEGEPSEAFKQLANNFENWKKDFIATAKSARGWCIAAFEQRTGKLCNILLDSYDTGVLMNMFPVLLIDMYEHGYIVDYQDNREAYIQEFMKNINWNVVNKRVEPLL